MPRRPATDPQSLRYLLSVLTAVAALATAFALYFGYQAREEHKKRLSIASELSAKKAELAKLREHKSAESVVVANPPLASRLGSQLKEPSAPSLSPDGSLIGNRLLHSPAIREMQRRTQLQMLRSIYEPLLAQLRLSPEQRVQFYDLQLTIDNPLATLAKFPNEAQSAEERAQIQTQIQQIAGSASSQIQEILGPGGYQLYQGYQNTQEERTLVEQFRQQVGSSSMQMTDWQSGQLRDTLIQARAQYPPFGDDPYDLAASDQAALARAASFLTPDQLTAFRDYMNNLEEIRREARQSMSPSQ